MLKVTHKDLIDTALAEVETLSVDEALALLEDEDSVFVDIRDPRELEREGKVPGAVHAPRGMLEFWIDPDSSYHKPFFSEDKTFVFYCAGGLRSALAAKTAQDMGLKPVAHLRGGIAAWIEADGAIDPPKERQQV